MNKTTGTKRSKISKIIDLKALDKFSDLKAGLTIALGQICEATGWHCGEVWLPTTSENVLELSTARWINSGINYNCDFALWQFQECSKNFIILPGEGLPGRVWSSQQPEWISNVSAESEGYFLRNQIAKLFGIKAALGLPIILKNQVIAVFVLFMLEPIAMDKSLLEDIQSAIIQLEELLVLHL
jgi:signal transduction protein with GAF and PtsI domain